MHRNSARGPYLVPVRECHGSARAAAGRGAVRDTSVWYLVPALGRLLCGGGRAGDKNEELELDVDSLAYGGNGVARARRLRRLRPTRAARRPRPRPRHQGEAQPRRGARDRASLAPGRTASTRRARTTRPAAAAASRTSPTRRSSSRSTRRCTTRCSVSAASPSRRSSRSFRASRRSSTTATSSSTRSRSTPAGPALGFHRAGRWDEVLESSTCWLTTDLGNGIRDAVRDWAREEGLEAYSQDDGGLPPPPRRPRGAQHRAGARAARDRARREVRAGYFVEVAPPFPRGALDSLGDQRLACRGDEPADEAPLGRGARSRRSSAACASASARTRSCRRTRRWPSGCTGSPATCARLTGGETVYDLYCGIGTIGLSLASHALTVWGIEVIGGGGRLRARERGAERDRERGVLRRQRRPGRWRSSSSAPATRTSSSSTRRARASPGRRSATRPARPRRGSSTSPATRPRSPAT